MPTIKDVAKHAEVSIATVSRIINNKGPISEKTRKKVYESMKELNYLPNEMARALQKKKSNIIGLIVPSIQYEFFGRLAEAVEETCHANGYKLMLCRSDENEDREIEMVSMLEGNKVDGIILCSRLGDTRIYAGKTTMPIVSIDREIEGFSTVMSDNYQGGTLAARVLIESGCSHPVLFGDHIPKYMPMNDRNTGFFEECRRLGKEPGHILASERRNDEGEAAAEFLRGFEKHRNMDGLFVTSDALASSIICSPEVQETGILDQMPVISYDGLEISKLLQISSVAQPIAEMGTAAAVQLMKEIEEQAGSRRFVFPVSLIERKSTIKYKRELKKMNFDKLTEYMDSLNKEYGIPAADCKITKGHEVIYRHMVGHADYEKNKPITEQTFFRFFSATKLITMTAVMQQIERGNLGLYDEVRKYLPEYGIMKVADEFQFEFPIRWPKSSDPCHYAHNPIRIIDLMTMTAGLSYDTDSEEITAVREKSGNQASTREVIAEIAKMPLVYEPAARYSYGLGHDVLAAVVEVITGRKYSDYLKENIFEPLGIQDLYFHKSQERSQADRVCALHMGVFGTDEIVPDNGSLSEGFQITANYESGGAGLAGTVDAYSIFIDALCNGGEGANGARILSEESVKMFTVPYTTGQMSRDFAMCGKAGYEYGLGVRVLVDGRMSKSPVGEFGWDGAAGAYVLIDTVNKVSIFYAQHVVGYPKAYHEIHPKIRDLAYEGILGDKL